MGKAPAIIGQREGSGVMRGRDVRFLLEGKADPELVGVIAKIAEVNHTNTEAIAELATMFNQMIDTMRGFADVSANMKSTIQQFQRGMEGELNDDSISRPDTTSN